MALAEFYEPRGKIKQAIREFEAELSLTSGDAELKKHIEKLQRTDRQQ